MYPSLDCSPSNADGNLVAGFLRLTIFTQQFANVLQSPGTRYFDVVPKKFINRSRVMTPMSRPDRVMYALLSLSMRNSKSTRFMGVISISWKGDGLMSTVSFVRGQISLVPCTNMGHALCK